MSWQAGRVPAIPAVIRESLKPLTIRWTPSENSHTAIGMVKSADSADALPQTSNNFATTEATSRGAPMNPSKGRWCRLPRPASRNIRVDS